VTAEDETTPAEDVTAEDETTPEEEVAEEEQPGTTGGFVPVNEEPSEETEEGKQPEEALQ